MELATGFEPTTFLLFLHLLVFAYWLGGDVGVFYLSRAVTNPDLPSSQRLFATQLLLGLDLLPRICLLLALPTGFTLAQQIGWLSVPDWVVFGLWLLAATWIAIVLRLHGGSPPPGLARVDTVARVALILALLALAVSGDAPFWLAGKMVCLALATSLGLYVRRCLKPLGPGLAALAAEDVTTANPLIASSIGRSRIPVLGIWLMLALAAWLALAKP